MAEKIKQEEETQEQLIARLQAQNEALKSELEQSQVHVKKLQAEGEGWLLTAPVADFDGNLHGIQFVNGQAFIPRSMRVAYFEIVPFNPTQMQRYLDLQFPKPPYTDEQREREAAGIREREQVPSSERAARTIASDYRYQMEWFGAERVAELRARLSERGDQRRRMEAMTATTQSQVNLAPPQYMGTGR